MENELMHHGVKGQKWGVRRYQNADGTLTAAGRQRVRQAEYSKQKVIETAFSVGQKINPREIPYKIKRLTNKLTDEDKSLISDAERRVKETGVLPTDQKTMEAIEKAGIEKHKSAVYDNLDDTDIERFKAYTNCAGTSRSINGYLAVGRPPEYEQRAGDLKASLRKNKISDVTVYRSCNFKYSTKGLAKKLDTMSESELAEMFGTFSKSFSGKQVNENRIYSTSTSPLFAIDTWRKINPTAAASYNTYLIINCKGASGVFTDGKTSGGKSLVNTKSQQEVILAPEKMQYRKLEYDKERKMFAITLDAIG